MDKREIVTATILGAIVGGAAGYLFFTDRGRSMCRQIESGIEDFSRELVSFRDAVQKAAEVANEGWKLLNDTLIEGGAKGSSPYSSSQTSPF